MNVPLLFFLWVLQGSIAAYYAYHKGRNPYLWFLIGCLFGVFGIFAIWMSKKPKKVITVSSAATSSLPKSLPQRSWYYLDAQSSQVGPISTRHLQDAWNEGVIQPKTYVWHEDMPEWALWETICQEYNLAK